MSAPSPMYKMYNSYIFSPLHKKAVNVILQIRTHVRFYIRMNAYPEDFGQEGYR